MSDDVKMIGGHLDADHLAELEAIKKYYGIQRTAEMLRVLIHKEARRIATESPSIIAHAVNAEAAQ